MITAQELRIGNLLQDAESRVKPVDWMDIKWCSELSNRPAEVFGLYAIPLTEEWLLKAGFDVHTERDGMGYAFIGNNPITFDALLMLKNTGKGWFYGNAHFKIPYVHSLQNLYFALCAEELTFTP